jgi:hypothetical protein
MLSGYRIDEKEDNQLFKDPCMLQRFKELSQIYKNSKGHNILYGLLQNVRSKNHYERSNA